MTPSSRTSDQRPPIQAQASPRAQARVPEDDFKNLLPRKLLYAYFILPVVVAFIFDPQSSEWDWETGLRATAGSALPFIFIPAAMHSLYRYPMPRILAKISTDHRRLALHVVVAAGVAALIAVLIHPLCVMIKVPKNDFTVGRFAVICSVIGIALVLPAVLLQQARNRQHRLEAAAAAQRRATLEAELQALQARTNPHFLFNSLNTVATLIPEDANLAEETLVRLADLFRYALDSSRTRWVTLERELEQLEDYLSVQVLRFGDRLSWSIEVADDIQPSSERMPPLTLQPLVENAVLHGASGETSVHVKILVERADDGLRVTVADNGAGAQGSHQGTGTSTADLAHRLALVYGKHDLLNSGPTEDGFRAQVMLPRETQKELA